MIKQTQRDVTPKTRALFTGREYMIFLKVKETIDKYGDYIEK